jgi:hypothetical protein
MKENIINQILKEKLKDSPNYHLIQQLQQLLDKWDKD